MKKKVLLGSVGLLVLVGGVMVATHSQKESSSPVKEEKKVINHDAESDAAFNAITALGSHDYTEEDIQAAQSLVDKLGDKGAALQPRLDHFKEVLAAWKGLDALLVVAEANPTDDAAAQAARAKYDELMGDVATQFYDAKSSYYLRVEGLQYKKGDVLVSQAETSHANEDFQSARDFVNGHLSQYIEVLDWETLLMKKSFVEEYENLVARLGALGAHHQQIAAAQAAAEAQAAAKAEQGGEVVASAGDGGQTYVGDQGGYTGGQSGYVGDQGSYVNGQTPQTPHIDYNKIYGSGRPQITEQEINALLDDPNSYHHLPDGTKVLKNDIPGLNAGITTFND